MRLISQIGLLLQIVLFCKSTVDGAVALAPTQDAQRITDLESQVKALGNKLKVLEDHYGTLQNDLLGHLKSETLSNEFKENQQMQFDVLTNLIIRQRGWLVDIKGLTKEKFGGLDKPTDDTKTKVATIRHHVVFSAYMDKDMDNSGKDQTIVFNKVLINEGSAYNKHTGVFTCPIDGLYDFSFVIGQRDKKTVRARLMVNSEVLVAVAVDAEHATQDLQGGNRVFVRLKKGDVVRVIVDSGRHVEGDTVRSTTFSGICVSP